MAAPRATLSDRVFAELRAGILSGRFRPGERLVEEKLSPEYGVSRVPMREAIKRLQAEGLATAAEDGRGAEHGRRAERLRLLARRLDDDRRRDAVEHERGQ